MDLEAPFVVLVSGNFEKEQDYGCLTLSPH